MIPNSSLRLVLVVILLAASTFSLLTDSPGGGLNQGIDSLQRSLQHEDFVISSISFKESCDYYYHHRASVQNYPVPDGASLPPDLPDNFDSIKQINPVIFVDEILLKEFISLILPKINFSFVLVSGDGDHSADLADLKLLDANPFLIHHYAMNCNIPLSAINSNTKAKFSCIPIGISQWNGQRENMARILNYSSSNFPLTAAKTKLSVFTASLHTNPERQSIREIAMKGVFTDIFHNGSISPFDYYEYVSHYHFIWSPPGNGLDCYRTYEALYLGIIPIVRSSNMDSVFDDLPVLIVERWEDVTVKLLNDTLTRFGPLNSTRWNWKKLTRHYWVNLFHSHK